MTLWPRGGCLYGGGRLLERRRLFDEIWYLNLNGSLKALTACGEKIFDVGDLFAVFLFNYQNNNNRLHRHTVRMTRTHLSGVINGWPLVLLHWS